jgi:predicted nucleic acid-binding protein
LTESIGPGASREGHTGREGPHWWRRAVLDTSVLLSAERHWLWLPARLGIYEGIWSAFIVGELVRIRTELSIRHQVPRAEYRRRINVLVHALSDVLGIVEYRHVTPESHLRDPDDEPILAAALAAGAGCVVSLNTRDFPSGAIIEGVRYATPEQFLAALDAGFPGDALRQRAADAGRQIP